MRKISPIAVIFIITISFFSGGCHKELIKDDNVPKLEKPDTIPPGHAQITGSIMEIEPIQSNASSADPCSKAPCIAKVKIKSIAYGAGFPVLSNKEVRIKFAFTLSPTTKDLFPNMMETYPGLKVGDNFSALVASQEAMNSSEPQLIVNGYSIIEN